MDLIFALILKKSFFNILYERPDWIDLIYCKESVTYYIRDLTQKNFWFFFFSFYLMICQFTASRSKWTFITYAFWVGFHAASVEVGCQVLWGLTYAPLYSVLRESFPGTTVVARTVLAGGACTDRKQSCQRGARSFSCTLNQMLVKHKNEFLSSSVADLTSSPKMNCCPPVLVTSQAGSCHRRRAFSSWCLFRQKAALFWCEELLLHSRSNNAH